MEQRVALLLAAAALVLLVAVPLLGAPVEATDCSAITYDTYGWTSDEAADLVRKAKKESCKQCCLSTGKKNYYLTNSQLRVCECADSAFQSLYSKFI